MTGGKTDTSFPRLKILGSQGDSYADYCLLVCATLSFVDNTNVTEEYTDSILRVEDLGWREVSSTLKMEAAVPPKCWYLSSKLLSA
jgi:hypothetical protein